MIVTVVLATNSNYNTYFTNSRLIKIGLLSDSQTRYYCNNWYLITDGINKFVNISRKISDSDFSIKCTFIDQSVESEKICNVEYSTSEATSDCSNNSSLPLIASASSSGSHSVDVGLDLRGPFSNSSKICFHIMASVTGIKTVIVEGAFDIGQYKNNNYHVQFCITNDY